MSSMQQFAVSEHERQLDRRWESFAKQIVNEQTADTFTMLYATDPHYIRYYPPYLPVYKKLEEMVTFSEYIGADLLAVTGDLVDGNTTADYQHHDLYDFLSLIRRAKTTSVLLSRGNHDDCAWYAFSQKLPAKDCVMTADQWFSHIINPLRVQYPMLLDEQNPGGGYYAIDYPFHKIRIINLNTSDMPWILNADGTFKDAAHTGQWAFGFQEAQLRWLVNMLQLPAGWSVLFMSHTCPLLDEEELATHEPFYNRELFLEILAAFRAGTAGRAVSREPYFNATVDYDFTKVHTVDILPYLYGHMHCDSVRVVDGITVIATSNLLTRTGPPCSWDCMLLDKKRRLLTCRRFGLPEQDRVIQY